MYVHLREGDLDGVLFKASIYLFVDDMNGG